MSPPLGLGLGLGLSGTGSATGSAVFDPATLSLSAWYKDYAGSPWESAASAGASATADDLTEGTNPPTAASGAADFDGTNDKLGCASTPYADLTGAITFVALVNFDAIANAINGPQPYSDTCLFVDEDGAFGVCVADDTGTKKLRAFAYTGAAYDIVDITTASFGTGAWKMIFVRYDGGANTFEGGTNDDALASGSANGSYNFALKTMKLGANYLGNSAFLNGKVQELMWSTTALSDDDRDDIRSYFNATYGLSL